MSRRAILASLALHAGLLFLVGWRWPSTAIGPGHAGADASFFADDAAGPLFTDSTPASEPATEPQLAEPEFIPPAPVVVPSARPISTIAALPAQLPAGTDTLPEVSAAKQNVSASRSGKTAHRVSARSGGNAGGRQSGTAGGGDGPGADDYVPPQFLVRYKPLYPQEAHAQRLEGAVLLLVAIDAAGRVTGANVLRGSGHAVLDRAALAAVRSWRFDPARQDGLAVAACVEVPVRFRFEERSTARLWQKHLPR